MSANNEYTASREELLALIKRYPSSEAVAPAKDIVAGRYRILTNQPLQGLSSKFAMAYGVHDEQVPGASLYALVYQNNAPLRQKNIEALKDFAHPNMVSLLAFAAVEISTLSEVRMVAVLERPSGQTLSSLLAEGKRPVSQTTLVNFLLRPLAEILKILAQKGISHNRINLDNVYMADNRILLGECISEPSGFSQHFLFEPIERILTLPLGKSDNAINADCYALAVLTLHLTLGFKPFTGIEKESFIEDVLVKGSYTVLAAPWDFSDELQDFLRGLLNDGRRERWDPESIVNWLSGRKFNLIQPSAPHESSRGFDCMGTVYYNRKAIANALFKTGQDAGGVLAENKLSRWVENSAHKPELTEMIARIASHVNVDNIRSVNEALARTITLLDPAGPIRFKHLSVMIDGMANVFAEAFFTENQEDIQTLVQMLDSDLPGFWLEQQPGTPPADYSVMGFKLPRVRGFMRMKGLGFGIERSLYDLLPGLPCQSKLVKRYHVTTLRDLLLALNIAAAQHAAEADFMDRHIAGFITSRLDIGKEMRVNELDALPFFASHAGLVALKLLIKAQNKVESAMELHGLCSWVAIKLMPVTDMLHKRGARQDFRKRLTDAAATGRLKNIANLLLKPDVFIADHNSFYEAVVAYTMRARQIGELNNQSLIMRHARVVGRGIAQTVSYGICLISVYYTLKAYLRF